MTRHLQVEFLFGFVWLQLAGINTDHLWKGFYFDSWPRKNKWPEVYFTTKGIAKERQGWRVCYLQRYLQDALNSHQIALGKVTSCSSSEGILKELYYYCPIHLHNGLFCQTVYKPVYYSFLKVDLDELLVKQVVELIGVASHQPSIIIFLIILQDHGVWTPIVLQSRRPHEFCYNTSWSVSC